MGLCILLLSTLTTLSISARSPESKVPTLPPPVADKKDLLLPNLPDSHGKDHNMNADLREQPMIYQTVYLFVGTTAANKCNSVTLKAPAAKKMYSLLVQLSKMQTAELKRDSLKR